jgi:hypothetical protein
MISATVLVLFILKGLDLLDKALEQLAGLWTGALLQLLHDRLLRLQAGEIVRLANLEHVPPELTR